MICNIVCSLVVVDCPYLNIHTYSVLDDRRVVAEHFFLFSVFIYSLYSFRNFKPGKKNCPHLFRKRCLRIKERGVQKKIIKNGQNAV